MQLGCRAAGPNNYLAAWKIREVRSRCNVEKVTERWLFRIGVLLFVLSWAKALRQEEENDHAWPSATSSL